MEKIFFTTILRDMAKEVSFPNRNFKGIFVCNTYICNAVVIYSYQDVSVESDRQMHRML